MRHTKLMIFDQILVRIVFVLFIAILFFQVSSNAAHAQWTDRNSVAGAGATSIKGAGISSDGQTMIIVGDGGFIKTSTNGGSSWTDRNSVAGSPAGNLNAAAIGPSGEMIVVGDSGYIRTSVNGGASWTDRNSAAGVGSTTLRAVDIGPSGQMLALGDSGYNRSSTDGGASWTDHNSACGCATLYMLGAAVGPSNTLLAVATDAMFSSANSGTNWTNRTTAGGVSGSDLYSAVIGSNGTMLAGGTGASYLRSSTDGGANWTNHASAAGLSTQNVRAVAIGSNGHMFAGGTTGFFKTSTNGGGAWSDLSSAAGAGSIDVRDIEVDSNGNILVVGTSGYVRTYSSNTAPTITVSPSATYNGYTRTGSSVNFGTSFSATDAEQTGSNQLTYYLHTGANRTGTQVGTGTFTSGAATPYTAYNASGMVEGTNTLYLSVYDGTVYASGNPSFTVLRDSVAPSSIASISTTPATVLSNNQYTVTMTATDATSTNSNELTYQVSTGIGGSGTMLASWATATTGVADTTVLITDAALAAGANTRYIRACDGAFNCTNQSFTVTKISPPTVTTNPVAALSNIGATFKGTINPNGVATTGYFRYWTTNPGSCSDVGGTRIPVAGGVSLGSGLSPVSYQLTTSVYGQTLTADTTYYYCAIADSGSLYYGSLLSLFTQSAPINSCDAPLTGGLTLSGDCQFPGSSNITGVDGGTLNINSGRTLTIMAGQQVAFQTIVKPGAFINKFSGGVMKKGYVWVEDGDGDGFFNRSTATISNSNTVPPIGGFVLRNTLNLSSLSQAEDCDDTDNTEFRELNLYVDADGDGYGTGAYTPTCTGQTAVAGYSVVGGDCLDSGGGAATVQVTAAVGTDVDQDTYSNGTTSSQCVSVATTTVNGKTYRRSTSGNFDRVEAPNGTADCLDSGGGAANVYQSIGSLATDTDQDRWYTGSSGTQCVGPSSVISGGTYYRNTSGVYSYITVASSLGGSDCNDSAYSSTNTCSTPPTVTTSAASSVTTTTAILNSTVNPNGASTDITYRYQTAATATCNASTPTSTLAGPTGLTGSSPLSGATTQASLGSLTPGQIYYFCVTATNSQGTTYGSVLNFTASTLANGSTCTAGSQCASGNCYVDADGDRHAPSSGTKTCKASTELAGVDCYDTSGGSGATSTYTGQTSYFSSANGLGNFDYDCSGGITSSPSPSQYCSSRATSDDFYTTYGTCGSFAVSGYFCTSGPYALSLPSACGKWLASGPYYALSGGCVTSTVVASTTIGCR